MELKLYRAGPNDFAVFTGDGFGHDRLVDHEALYAVASWLSVGRRPGWSRTGVAFPEGPPDLLIFEVRDRGFSAVAGPLFCEGLCADEALGVVASLIYRPEKPLPYMRDYEQWLAMQRHYRIGDVCEPVAMLCGPRSS